MAEARGFAAAYRGMYPNFVFGGELEAAIAPVFYYHSVPRHTFEEHLRYLNRNGYRTLSGDEIYEDLARAARNDERRVALTFDDGLEQLYTVVYPLLQEFGCTAIAYIVPAAIGTPGFLTWEQVREMHASGRVDFQSHSMTHSAIFTSPEIVNFFHPGFAHFPPWDVPVTSYRTDDVETPQVPPYGAPIYGWSSRLSDLRRYVPDGRVHALSVSFVAANGGARFFRRRGWHRRLRTLVGDFTRGHDAKGLYETDDAMEKSVQEEIELSRDAIEEQLPGKRVRHFAFPWHQSGAIARHALLNAGYQTVAGGLSLDHRPKALGRRGFEVARVSGDFVPTLPGRGRRRFWRIMVDKAIRRGGRNPY
jgi:Polysaccharide deacetylase